MVESTNTTAITDVQYKKKNPSNKRLLALDIVRGYAMLLMLVSHSSWWLEDLDYGVAYGWDNMIVPTVSLPESIPGFVLQLATPAFFLLGGFSIALFTASRRRQGWTEGKITRFLVVRGLVLIALDLTITNLTLSEPFYAAHLSVLTGIGICVSLMAWLRRLDWRVLVGIMVLVLVATQLYYYSLTMAGEWPREESIVRAALIAPSVEDVTWKTQFPALPWLPIVLLGFVTGSRVVEVGSSLGKLSLRLGLGCLVLFVGNMIAGDVGSLYPADPFIFGKHPPDLDYISLYTGLTFLLIALHSMIERIKTLPLKLIIVLGQTALFFYVIHIRMIEFVSPLFASLPLPAMQRSLLIVLAVLPFLLVICWQYQALRRRYPNSVLQYL